MPRNVVRSGLVSYIDPRDSASYNGSGTTVTDLSGKGNDWIIQGNVSWDSTNGFGNFTGNSTGSGNKLYAKVSSAYYNLKTSQNGTGYTICIWAKSTGGTGAWRGLIKNADGENYIDLYQSPTGLWHQDGSGEYLYYNDGNYVANDSLTMSDSVWRMYVATNLNNGTTTNPSTGLTIGNEPNGSGTGANAYPWVGQVGAVLIYNRVLSKQELVNNFAAFSSVYGVSGSSGIPAAGFLVANEINSSISEGGVYASPGVDSVVGLKVIGNKDMVLNFQGFKTPTNKTKATWSYTGGDQSWTVPANVFYVWAKIWGAGGGGGCAGGWTHGAQGGAGGFSDGLIPVTPGEVLTIRVPRGGYRTPGATNAPYGGGSSTSGGDNQYAGGGGGYCGIFRSSQPLLIAGGGAGGGSTTNWNQWCHGGAGGGVEGEHGYCEIYTYAGTGGGPGAGGTGGNGNNTGGGGGSSLQGGSVQGNVYGGGGGGGYFGGGSGSYGNGYIMGGGGGGSGYVHTTVLLGGTYTGSRTTPPFAEDPDLPKTGSTYQTHAFGGQTCGHGGDGYCVIYY